MFTLFYLDRRNTCKMRVQRGQVRSGRRTIAAQEPDQAEIARSLLAQGYAVKDVAARTTLSVAEVEELAGLHTPDVSLLAKHVDERLRDLGMTYLGASKLGILSRSTLVTLGHDGRVPSANTLAKLDELCSWEPGSARASMFGVAPVPREAPDRATLTPPDPDAEDDYLNLGRYIEERLRELNMTKSRFAAIGGPGRSTLATLGKRGYQPSPETLDKIDTYLLWEPGSALVALKGGVPIRRGPAPTPHPSLIPLNAVKDRLRGLSARLTRQIQSSEQMLADVDEALKHVNLAIDDLGDPRRRDALAVPDFGMASSVPGEAAGEEQSDG